MRTRGSDALQAALLAEAKVTVLYTALDHWLDHSTDQPLSVLVLDILATCGTALNPAATNARG